MWEECPRRRSERPPPLSDLAETRASSGARTEAAAPAVALATCAEMPDLDDEARLLAGALQSVGLVARPAVWTDPNIHWADFGLVVIRLTWDYIFRREEFVTWVRSLPLVANPADILVWNTDKRYLADLMRAGAPVIPTRFIGPGDRVDLPEGEIVVKPTVSAGSIDTSLYGPDEMVAASDHVRALQLEGRTAMVQPYRATIDDEAETGLVYLGQRFSHAIRKAPMLRKQPRSIPGHIRDHVITARSATAAELEVAEAVLDAMPGGRERLLYARVDLVPGPSGPELMELEVTEPDLYLGLEDGAPQRLAEAIAELLR
jgi:glutathione synthase/RimK-type ligase-like ATP-grasp enzyme